RESRLGRGSGEFLDRVRGSGPAGGGGGTYWPVGRGTDRAGLVRSSPGSRFWSAPWGADGGGGGDGAGSVHAAVGTIGAVAVRALFSGDWARRGMGSAGATPGAVPGGTGDARDACSAGRAAHDIAALRRSRGAGRAGRASSGSSVE